MLACTVIIAPILTSFSRRQVTSRDCATFAKLPLQSAPLSVASKT